LAAIRIAGRIVDLHLVESRRKRSYLVEALENGAVLEFCHRRRDEDAEMADMRVDEIDDALASTLEVVGVPIDDGNPAQRLMRRRDVVAPGSEDHDRVADAAQVGNAAVAHRQGSPLQAIAHEEIVHNRENLVSAEEIEAAPPALEVEEPRALAVDMREQVAVFLPHRLRLEALEILHQPGAVEPPVAEIGGEMGGPGAAEQATGDAHRVHAGLAAPVGERRS